MPNSLFLRHLQMKPLLNLQHSLIWLDTNIRNIGINHQTEQVKDEIRRFTERSIRREAILLELEIQGGGSSAHALDHFLAEFHHGCERLGVSAEDEAEVGVEEVTVGRKEEVLEVTVADAEEVGDYAIPGAGFDVGVHCFFADAEGFAVVRIVGFEVGEDGFVFGGDGGEGGGGDELDGAGGGVGG